MLIKLCCTNDINVRDLLCFELRKPCLTFWTVIYFGLSYNEMTRNLFLECCLCLQAYAKILEFPFNSDLGITPI